MSEKYIRVTVWLTKSNRIKIKNRAKKDAQAQGSGSAWLRNLIAKA